MNQSRPLWVTGLITTTALLSACGGTSGSSNSSPPASRSSGSTDSSTSSGSNATTYTVGGTVNGLTGSGLVLQDNGSDNLTVNADGQFTFATALPSGQSYSVTVRTQPTSPAQLCVVTSAGTGTISSANVANVEVDCRYTVGGTVNALSGSGLVLQDNGGDNLTVNADGQFTFATALPSGQSYSVTVAAQPTSPAQLCAVTSAGTGTISSANVTNVEVDCRAVPTFNIAEYSVPNLVAGLANGHDGNLWALSQGQTNSLNRISTNGTVQTMAIQGSLATTSSGGLSPPLAGPDGNLWTASSTSISNVSLTGVLSTLISTAGTATACTPTASTPEVFDGNGNLWYLGGSGTICSVTTNGNPVVSTTYSHSITSMALGRDGSVWFTSRDGNVIGAITQSGQITTYPLPVHSDNVNPDGSQEGSVPEGIALGADGNMWFVEDAQPTKRIGSITPSGVITEYTVTGAEGYVLGPAIAVGPDGNMWFSVWSEEVGYITPSGQVSISTLPTANAWPSSMTAGPDGRMWFTEPANLAAAGQVGAITLTIPTPSNDNFANATTLGSAVGFLASNNINATAESGEPSTDGVAPQRTLWWSWTAPATGTLVLSTYGSSYETVVGVYTGSQLSSLTNIEAAHQMGSGLTSVSVPVTSGTTYDIVVDGYNGAAGVLMLDWRMN